MGPLPPEHNCPPTAWGWCARAVYMPMLRLFLHNGRPQSGLDILDDVFVGHEPGAEDMLRLALQMRANPRTRRGYAEVRQA